MSEWVGGSLIVLITVGIGFGIIFTAAYYTESSYTQVTIHTGIVQYTSTTGGQTTLVVGNQLVVCNLSTNQNITSPVWHFRVAPTSPLMTVLNLKIGQFVVIEQNYLGGCLITTAR